MAFEETVCEGVEWKRNPLCKLQQFIFWKAPKKIWRWLRTTGRAPQST
jgi:hypothetical protein